MDIRNLMEDIVYCSVEEVLKRENRLTEPTEYIEDICAYVLNRIPAKYVTSERGILHGLLDAKFYLQQKTDVIFLIHEAIDVIRSRRDLEENHISKGSNSRTYYLPHLLGEVVEETTFSKIKDVSVTLFYNGVPARMISDGWNNPFFTNGGTSSYYHFWPDISDVLNPDIDYEFTLEFTHPLFETKEYVFTVHPVAEYNTTSSHAIPIMLLTLKKGCEDQFNLSVDEEG